MQTTDCCLPANWVTTEVWSHREQYLCKETAQKSKPYVRDAYCISRWEEGNPLNARVTCKSQEEPECFTAMVLKV